MSLPNIEVTKAFLERYIKLRLKTWKMESYKDITEKSFDTNPKLTVVAQCLSDLQEVADMKDKTSSSWMLLLFKLHNHFKNGRANSGILGYVYDPKICDHLRYMMSYICHSLCKDPEIFADIEQVKKVLEVKQKSEQAAGRMTEAKETEDRIAHIINLAKNFHLYKADSSAKCDECFQLNFHIEKFDNYKDGEKTFEEFEEESNAYDDTVLSFCRVISEKFKIYQKAKQSSESKSEDKALVKPVVSSSSAITKSLNDYVKEKQAEPVSPLSSAKKIPSPVSDVSSSDKESDAEEVQVKVVRPTKPIYRPAAARNNNNTQWKPKKTQNQTYANVTHGQSNSRPGNRF